MMTSDETQLMSGRQVANRQGNDRKESNNASSPIKEEHKGSWKKVAFGAASGILVGAGAMYAASALGAENSNEADTNDGQPGNVKVAKVDDDLSFQDAFDAARGQVGPGGVFRWHGGLYSTYNEDEWGKMSDEDKAEFAQAVRPEVRADEIVAERMSEEHPDAVSAQTTANDTHETAQVDDDVQVAQDNGNDMAMNASDQTADANDGDVYVVGQGYVDGHQAVALDLTGNGVADVVVIDVDDSNSLTDADVVIDSEGNSATLGELAQAAREQGDGYDYAGYDTDPNMDSNLQQTACENPDLSPDMPDYMDDASVDGTLV